MSRYNKFIKKTDKFIETGSYVGDGIQLAIDSGFVEIYSIELSERLHHHCLSRFRDNLNVNLIHGDSAVKLKELLDNNINIPFTFWLDGHWSEGITARGPKDTPLYEELVSILSRNTAGEVIYIDDMRDFRNHHDISLKKILSLLKMYKPEATYRFESSKWDPEDCMVIEY